MKLKEYFKDFDFENKTKMEKKQYPFIAQFSDYNCLITYKYTVKEFREILKRFQLPRCKSTRRNDIQEHCVNLLYLSHNICKIQKIWRNHFIRLYNKTLGPSYGKKHLSNNVDDFLTTEKIEEIDYYYYFSFKDNDNFVYTFNLVSIVTLLNKNILKNPYNRSDFDTRVIIDVKKRLRYNSILNKISVFQNFSSQPASMNDRVNQLFHHMDQLGNYTNSTWFLELNSSQIRFFLFELHEIWNYRAQLSLSVKEIICPPRGNPFFSLPRNFISNYNNNRIFFSLNFLRNAALDVMEKLSYSAHSDTNKNMGVLYILSAFTLVSQQARDALPWLYASVEYN
tara:strand:+ start:5210 stop:6226 length:1017 start_codon:yes stop_codon:yes gene_type:complete